MIKELEERYKKATKIVKNIPAMEMRRMSHKDFGLVIYPELNRYDYVYSNTEAGNGIYLEADEIEWKYLISERLDQKLVDEIANIREVFEI